MQIAASFAGDKQFKKPPLASYMFETKQERADREEREGIAFKLRVQALARIAAKKPKTPRGKGRG